MLILKSANKKNPLSDHSGFTLIEVMFSVWLIAFIVVSLFRMQSGSIRLVSANRFSQQAPIAAQQVLNRIVMELPDLTADSGDLSPAFPGMEWKCSVEPAQITFSDEEQESENTGQIFKIAVTVRSKGSGHSLDFVTWRYSDE